MGLEGLTGLEGLMGLEGLKGLEGLELVVESGGEPLQQPHTVLRT